MRRLFFLLVALVALLCTGCTADFFDVSELEAAAAPAPSATPATPAPVAFDDGQAHHFQAVLVMPPGELASSAQVDAVNRVVANTRRFVERETGGLHIDTRPADGISFALNMPRAAWDAANHAWDSCHRNRRAGCGNPTIQAAIFRTATEAATWYRSRGAPDGLTVTAFYLGPNLGGADGVQAGPVGANNIVLAYPARLTDPDFLGTPDKAGRGSTIETHEDLHAAGAVLPCQGGDVHITDDPGDIMDPDGGQHISKGRYYRHDRPGCPDTEDALWWRAPEPVEADLAAAGREAARLGYDLGVPATGTRMLPGEPGSFTRRYARGELVYRPTKGAYAVVDATKT